MMKIAIVDDHRLVQGGLKRILEDQPDFRIVAEGYDGLEAQEIVLTKKPDILLLTLGFQKSMASTSFALWRKSATKIIVISIHADPSYVVEALNLGAMGYVVKESRPEEFLECIRQVSRGQRYVSSVLRDCLLSKLFAGKRQQNADPHTLAEREKLVLKMAAEGASANQIGTTLHISRRTAETHRANLMRKLGLKSQTDLVRFAIRTQLIVP